MNSTGRVMGIVLLIVLVILLLGGAGAMGFGGFGMMGPGMMGGYGGMMRGFGAPGFAYSPVGSILMLIFWAFIITGIVLLIVWVARNAGRGTRSTSSSNSALEILQTRYAKGEITKDQYEEMRRALA